MKKEIVPRKVRYVGNHPWIKGRIGDYGWNEHQKSFLFRPDEIEGNSQWFRVHYKNLEPLEVKND